MDNKHAILSAIKNCNECLVRTDCIKKATFLNKIILNLLKKYHNI